MYSNLNNYNIDFGMVVSANKYINPDDSIYKMVYTKTLSTPYDEKSCQPKGSCDAGCSSQSSVEAGTCGLSNDPRKSCTPEMIKKIDSCKSKYNFLK